jgi:hypothetical protein
MSSTPLPPVEELLWPYGPYSCSNPEKVSGIKEYIVLDMNLHRVFRVGAKMFNDYDPGNIHHLAFEIFHQLFFALLERAGMSIIKGLYKPKENKQEEENSDKNKRGKKNRTGSKKTKKHKKKRISLDTDDEDDENERSGEESGIFFFL